MTQVSCHSCNRVFYAKPSWIKNGYGKFCSRTCAQTAKRTGKTVSCFICLKQIYKSQKALRGSKSGKYFCGKTCQTRWRNKKFSGDKHPNWKSGHHAYRQLLENSGMSKQCTLCTTKDKRVLAAHHIDQNRANNTVENLAWLCHNCHHLVHHYEDEYERFMAAIV